MTAGGHVSTFHAGMRGAYDLLHQDYDLVGARGGVSGLLQGSFAPLDPSHLEIDRAGSMFGADRTNLGDKKDPDVLRRNTEKIHRIVAEHGIEALIMMGGDNHLGEAAKLYASGIKIVGWPKTMDGNLASDVSSGWITAVSVGAEQTLLHHHTAMTNERVFYVGLFGRDTDWVPVGVSAFGHADLCIPCERSYKWEYVANLIIETVKRNKDSYGINFAVIPFSEGASIDGLALPDASTVAKDAHGNPKLSPERMGLELVGMTDALGYKASVQVHSYSLRDAPPRDIDSRLAKVAGEETARLILHRRFGLGIRFTLTNNGSLFTTQAVPLEQLARQRSVSDTGFFNYDTLQPTPAFSEFYGPLFSQAMELTPHKPVYRNMRPT